MLPAPDHFQVYLPFGQMAPCFKIRLFFFLINSMFKDLGILVTLDQL